MSDAHEARIGSLEGRQTDLERRFTEAFPGGDHMGHCRYHELMIEGIEEKRKLRQAVQEKTISGLVWAAMVGLAYAIWQYLKSSLGKP